MESSQVLHAEQKMGCYASLAQVQGNKHSKHLLTEALKGHGVPCLLKKRIGVYF